MVKNNKEFMVASIRKGFVPNNELISTVSDEYNAILHAAAIEMANQGFVVKPEDLTGMTPEELTTMIDAAREIIGSDRAMTPVYPGFPQQVEELSTMTLFMEQILHYWSFGLLIPDYPEVLRNELKIEDILKDARPLEVKNSKDLTVSVLDSVLSKGVSMSPVDVDAVNTAIAENAPTMDSVAALVKKAPNGENIQTFVKALKNTGKYDSAEVFKVVAENAKTLDILLRVMLTLYGKPSNAKYEDNFDVTLANLGNGNANSVAMNNVPRSVRSALIEAIGRKSKDYNADNLVKREQLWRRVMRAVHPYDRKLDEAQKRAMDIIHGNIEYRTFNSLVEEAFEQENFTNALNLLENSSGELLRRIVSLLRIADSRVDAQDLSAVLLKVGAYSSLSTLISAYNGVINANEDRATVNRVNGLNNTMLKREIVKVNDEYLEKVSDTLFNVIVQVLAKKDTPTTDVVGSFSTENVSLVNRDLSLTDKVMERGSVMDLPGNGNILRVFGHFNNNQNNSGYMDVGAVLLDADFNKLDVCTWNTWTGSRDWATYSGDKFVYPGDHAAEYIDVKLDKVKNQHPNAKWVVMTVQSYSGWPIVNVDFIAGAMFRSGSGQDGEVFDARSVKTAFKPTTSSLQAVPYAVNLETNQMVWLDSSSGSTVRGASSSNDETIGDIVYSEIGRKMFSMTDLATAWAKAHDVEVDETKPVDKEALYNLFN